LDDELKESLQIADSHETFRSGAKLFGQAIQLTLQKVVKEQKPSGTKWTTTLGNFLIKIYPITKLSSRFILGVADVFLNFLVADSKGASCLPLSAAASGLAIILQVTSGLFFSI
jgi:hypothetical protein